jgi:hypothetical protein
MPALILIAWLVFGIASCIVAQNRGANGCLWFGMGLFLGPIGLALAFASGDKTTTCSRCQKEVTWKSVSCQHCGYVFGKKPLANPGVKKCPFCAEMILIEAKKCRFCGEFLANR